MTQLTMLSESRSCKRCNGAGSYLNKGFTTLEGKVYPDETKQCFACNGRGQFAAPDAEAIRRMIVNPKTKKLFSTSLHSQAGKKRHLLGPTGEWRRAQYVWRMVLWHTGADGRGFNLGGAIMADMDIAGDPWQAELDAMVDALADEIYGKGANLRGARRWGQALYGR